MSHSSLPPDDLETAIADLERSDSDRPSVEVLIKQEKNSILPHVPNTRLAQVVAGLIALVAIIKLVLEILK